MYALVVIAALGLAPTETEAPPPPPVAVEQPSFEELEPPPPPPPPGDTFEETTPPPPSPPLTTPDAPDAAGGAVDATGEEGPGLSAFPTGALQVVGGCATLAACSAVGAIPVVGGIALPVSGLLTPLLIGVVETSVGDFAGQTRGALLWPVLGAYAAEWIGLTLTAGAGVLTLFLAGGGGALLGGLFGGGGGPSPEAILGGLFGAYLGVFAAMAVFAIGGILTAIATVVTPAVIYAMTAEPKKPGDTEFRFPGILSPAHAAPEGANDEGDAEGEARRAVRAPAVVSMAY